MREQAGQPTLFATSCMVGREDKRMNNRPMFPTLKNYAAAKPGSCEIGLLKGAGLLEGAHGLVANICQPGKGGGGGVFYQGTGYPQCNLLDITGTDHPITEAVGLNEQILWKIVGWLNLKRLWH